MRPEAWYVHPRKMDATRIEELRRYQAKSRRIQTWSVRVLLAGVPAGLLTAVLARADLGLAIAAIAAIVGGAGFWITRGHIEEFEQQLRARGRR